jgi:two-component system chemotaxis response regulator CheB
MKNSGAYTIAQDEKTSVVYGMPKEANKLGAAQDIISLDQIAGSIVNYMKKQIQQPTI